jgi:hypothetical protein
MREGRLSCREGRGKKREMPVSPPNHDSNDGTSRGWGIRWQYQACILAIVTLVAGGVFAVRDRVTSNDLLAENPTKRLLAETRIGEYEFVEEPPEAAVERFRVALSAVRPQVQVRLVSEEEGRAAAHPRVTIEATQNPDGSVDLREIEPAHSETYGRMLLRELGNLPPVSSVVPPPPPIPGLEDIGGGSSGIRLMRLPQTENDRTADEIAEAVGEVADAQVVFGQGEIRFHPRRFGVIGKMVSKQFFSPVTIKADWLSSKSRITESGALDLRLLLQENGVEMVKGAKAELAPETETVSLRLPEELAEYAEILFMPSCQLAPAELTWWQKLKRRVLGDS